LKIFSPFSVFEQLALALKNRVFSEIFHCIDYTLFIIQDFWATCACSEKQMWPEILHCIEEFLSFRIFEQLMFALKFFTVLNILFTFKIFEQLALALKNKECLEITYWMHISDHLGFLSNLRLRCKTEFALKFFTGLKYFLSFRNFSNLRLPWKQNLPWKFSSRGRQPPSQPPASYDYGPMVYSRGSQSGVHVPLGVHLRIWRGTFKVSNRREIYICISFISKYLYINNECYFQKTLCAYC